MDRKRRCEIGTVPGVFFVTSHDCNDLVSRGGHADLLSISPPCIVPDPRGNLPCTPTTLRPIISCCAMSSLTVFACHVVSWSELQFVRRNHVESVHCTRPPPSDTRFARKYQKSQGKNGRWLTFDVRMFESCVRKRVGRMLDRSCQ